ncbi:MAG: FkbM family methyltransferase, partial [Acidaminococcaceae bacterium]|nr:FkbM family methyltransferase [Acidaminococcaceae bacterium]
MLSFIREKNTLWKYLKTAGKPIVLYGTGDGADKVIACLEAEGLGVSGICASDEFVWGQQFHGFTVGKYSELLYRKEPVIALICFASELPEQLERFYELARVHETYAPH